MNVRIPQGLNSQRDITLTVSSAAIATPVGGSNGKLSLTFPAGETTPRVSECKGELWVAQNSASKEILLEAIAFPLQ